MSPKSLVRLEVRLPDAATAQTLRVLGMFVVLVVLLLVAGAMIMARRKRAKRHRAAAVKTARLRALRKPTAPFVSSSLRGSTPQEPQKSAFS